MPELHEAVNASTSCMRQSMQARAAWGSQRKHELHEAVNASTNCMRQSMQARAAWGSQCKHELHEAVNACRSYIISILFHFNPIVFNQFLISKLKKGRMNKTNRNETHDPVSWWVSRLFVNVALFAFLSCGSVNSFTKTSMQESLSFRIAMQRASSETSTEYWRLSLKNKIQIKFVIYSNRHPFVVCQFVMHLLIAK